MRKRLPLLFDFLVATREADFADHEFLLPASAADAENRVRAEFFAGKPERSVASARLWS